MSAVGREEIIAVLTDVFEAQYTDTEPRLRAVIAEAFAKMDNDTDRIEWVLSTIYGAVRKAMIDTALVLNEFIT